MRDDGPHSPDTVLPIVYEELRRLARSKLARLPPGQTLAPTALVHEAYLRLLRSHPARWDGTRQFFAAAAEAMRQILVEQARRKHSLKRGGGHALEELHESRIACQGPDEEILQLHEALEDLGRADATSAELVKLRYFVGMTLDEAATALEIAPRTADRLWAYARAWLRRRIKGDPAA